VCSSDLFFVSNLLNTQAPKSNDSIQESNAQSDEVKNRREIKSFAIRQGRMSKRQKHAIEHNWSKWGVSFVGEPILPASYFKPESPIVLEIGFGMGDSLAEMAKQAPDTGFIGIEVHKPGVGALLALAEEQSLENIRVIHHDAVEVLNVALPDACFDRVQLFFPDPWHKSRHHKRRLIQPEFVQLLRAKLKLGGILHMATDWENYAEHMLEVVDSAVGFVNCAGENNYSPRPDYRPFTKFEKRGERLGHGVWDLLFKRNA
jgi:tRNA (guanine-N7-)-methyltransferase